MNFEKQIQELKDIFDREEIRRLETEEKELGSEEIDSGELEEIKEFKIEMIYEEEVEMLSTLPNDLQKGLKVFFESPIDGSNNFLRGFSFGQFFGKDSDYGKVSSFVLENLSKCQKAEKSTAEIDKSIQKIKEAVDTEIQNYYNRIKDDPLAVLQGIVKDHLTKSLKSFQEKIQNLDNQISGWLSLGEETIQSISSCQGIASYSNAMGPDSLLMKDDIIDSIKGVVPIFGNDCNQVKNILENLPEPEPGKTETITAPEGSFANYKLTKVTPPKKVNPSEFIKDQILESSGIQEKSKEIMNQLKEIFNSI